MVLICLTHNILFKAKHIPGVHNKLADSLSRLQVYQFRQIAPPDMELQPTVVASELANTVTNLIASSLQPSFVPTYQRAWKLFELFYHNVFTSAKFNFPIDHSVLALFIAYLFNQHYAPSTVNTYVSALGY